MIGDILICPRCRSAVHRTDDQWLCNIHGCVAKQRDGLTDFLYGTAEIQMASAGVWDLVDDQRQGIQLLEMFPDFSYPELKEHVRRHRTDSDGFVDDPHARLMIHTLA